MINSKKKCEICCDNESKYKCPTCFVIYCSLNCYKSHKEKCIKPEPKVTEPSSFTDLTSAQIEKEAEKAITPPKLVDYEDEINSNAETDPDIISFEKLKLLENSNELKQALGNKHLRELLLKINQHDQNIDKTIEEAMQEPLFQEFSSLCLKLVQDPTELNKN